MRRWFTTALLYATAATAAVASAAPPTAPAPPPPPPATRPVAVVVPTATAPAVVESRLPLTGGRLDARALADALGPDVGLAAPAVSAAPTASAPASIDLAGDRGERFARHLTATLGPACGATADAAALTLRVDRRALWTDDLAKRRLARLVATGSAERPAPAASAPANDPFGLTLPAKLDPANPLVLMIHGLASDNGVWGSMADQLTADGQQVGYFCYSDKESITIAGDLLADCLADVRLRHPNLPVRVLAHSMGGLVTRHYLEGPAFHGGIDRLVMLGTPNQGSDCANWRWMLELYQHYCEGKPNPNWSLWQVSKDCNGQAGRDLQPGSAFLTALNARPRRAGVKYTVVAGNRNAFRNHTAGWVEGAGDVFPEATYNWAGIRSIRWAVSEKGKSMRAVDSSSDGVVPLEHAKLAGVDDFVVVNADHVALACGHPPAAWDVVRARLK